jgi:hypothetical protein
MSQPHHDPDCAFLTRVLPTFPPQPAPCDCGAKREPDPRPAADPVNNPTHYTSHPSGVECIQVTEHYNFNLGNAIKYVWRAGIKSPNPVEDLKKAAWYINREIKRLTKI